MLRRRWLTEEAGRLMQQSGHVHNDLNSPTWRKAIDMLKEADPDSLAPLENQLRSPRLNPRQRFLAENTTELERQRLVTEVIVNRANLLPLVGMDSSQGNTGPRGRLLAYYPEENVSDGASKYASKGFYDPFDAPPWDLWVSYDRGELISWVPEGLISLAQEGIDANPVACIQWAEPTVS